MDDEIIDEAAINVLAGNLGEVQYAVREYPRIINGFKDGEGLLHLAVDNGQEAIAELLLNAGCDPNSKNGEGESALHMAVFRGYSRLVNLLIQHNADPYIVNNENKSVFDYSNDFFNPEVNELLQQYLEQSLAIEDLDYSLSFSEESKTINELPNPIKPSPENELIISFTEPSIIEESTHYSALCSNLKYVQNDRLETKNYSSNEDLLDFLHEIKLRKYFRSLFKEGFDNLDWLFLQMLTPFKIDHKTLQMAGVDSQADRNSLIKELENKALGYQLKRSFNGILELFIETGLDPYFSNFSKSSTLDLQELVTKAIQDPAQFDSFLKDSVKISKLGHRIRILGSLQSLSTPTKHKLCHLL